MQVLWISDDCISIGWQMLLSLSNKLPPILKANCPHNKCNCVCTLAFVGTNSAGFSGCVDKEKIRLLYIDTSGFCNAVKSI